MNLISEAITALYAQFQAFQFLKLYFAYNIQDGINKNKMANGLRNSVAMVVKALLKAPIPRKNLQKVFRSSKNIMRRIRQVIIVMKTLGMIQLESQTLYLAESYAQLLSNSKKNEGFVVDAIQEKKKEIKQIEIKNEDL